MPHLKIHHHPPLTPLEPKPPNDTQYTSSNPTRATSPPVPKLSNSQKRNLEILQHEHVTTRQGTTHKFLVKWDTGKLEYVCEDFLRHKAHDLLEKYVATHSPGGAFFIPGED